MSDTNVEKGGYSGFERFLFFLTPILFTAVLLGVLLLILNAEWRNSALEVGHKIPVVGKMLPAAKEKTTSGDKTEELSVANARQKVDEMNTELLNKQTELQQAQSKAAELQKTIDDQKQQIDALTKQMQDKTVNAEQYDAKIRSLADMYAKMTPSKAAPILEKMTVEEASLVLGAMSDTVRGRILEKMTPKVAADVTIHLKDASSVQDQEMAALQARIKELEQQTNKSSSTLDIAELKTTFSTMQPSDAAKLLLNMAGTEQAKALRILGALDDASRAQVLSAMTALSDEGSKTAAQLVSKLMPANP